MRNISMPEPGNQPQWLVLLAIGQGRTTVHEVSKVTELSPRDLWMHTGGLEMRNCVRVWPHCRETTWSVTPETPMEEERFRDTYSLDRCLRSGLELAFSQGPS